MEPAHFDWRWRERPVLALLAWEAQLAIRWRGYAASKWSQLERQLIFGATKAGKPSGKPECWMIFMGAIKAPRAAVGKSSRWVRGRFNFYLGAKKAAGRRAHRCPENR